MNRLSVMLRRGAPEILRRGARLAKVVSRRPVASQRIPPELVDDCWMVASRTHLVRRLPAGGRIAEIGAYKGDFTRFILRTAEPKELHLFDLDFSLLARDVAADPRLRLHRGASPGTLSALEDGAFDWIYVDGDHSYEAVLADATAAAAKLKPGGYLVFNDFAHIDPGLGSYGVHRAVVDFAVREKWPFAIFSYDPNALYDVALRKPRR